MVKTYDIRLDKLILPPAKSKREWEKKKAILVLEVEQITEMDYFIPKMKAVNNEKEVQELIIVMRKYSRIQRKHCVKCSHKDECTGCKINRRKAYYIHTVFKKKEVEQMKKEYK